MSRNPHKNPNPQGKGLVPVLNDWSASRPTQVTTKEPVELLFDWFVSTLVLSAAFKFRPVVGQCYFLYLQEGDWQLSLVGPQEWGTRSVGDCLGTCQLRVDMTWSIEADPQLAQKPALQQALAALAESFVSNLNSEDTLGDHLPGYRRELPYFQRMLATGLGSSLRQSISNPETLALPARAVLAELGGGVSQRLLAQPARSPSPAPSQSAHI
jgi:hypothetical protein